MAFTKRDPMETAYFTGESYYASVHTPNTRYEKKYVLQLALEGAELEKAKKLKLKIKAPSKYVPKQHIEIKRVVRSEATKAPTVIDASNNPFPKDVMLGNGTVVKVKVGLYDNKRDNMAAYMDTVKVVKLVKFESTNQEEAEFMAVAEADGGAVEGLKVNNSDMDDEIPFDSSPKKAPVKAKVTTTG